MRTSRVAYVVVRLLVGGRDCLLLQHHRKWGDWSLVGGHAELSDGGDWRATAKREADEELIPLRFCTDFTLDPIPHAPTQWGPQESRSAHGELTHYDAAWFALRFLRNPVDCLNRLPRGSFVLIERELALRIGSEQGITSLLQRLESALPAGLSSVPLAWPNSLSEADVSIEVRHESGPFLLRNLKLSVW